MNFGVTMRFLLLLIFILLSLFSHNAAASAAEVLEVIGEPRYTNGRYTMPVKYRPFASNDPRFAIASSRARSQMGAKVLGFIAKRNPYWIAASLALGFVMNSSGDVSNRVTSGKTITLLNERRNPIAQIDTITQADSFAEPYIRSTYGSIRNFSIGTRYTPKTIPNTEHLSVGTVFEYSMNTNFERFNSSTSEFYAASASVRFYIQIGEPKVDDYPLELPDAQKIYDNETGHNPDGTRKILPMDAFVSDSGKPLQEAFEYVTPYPSLSPDAEVALNNVARGLAQTTNPNSPYYYNTELYNQLQALLSNLHRGLPTIDPYTNKVVDGAYEKLPDNSATPQPDPAQNPQPVNVTVNVPEIKLDALTQAQYEESNAKQFEQFNTEAQTQLDSLEALETKITDTQQKFIDDLGKGISDESLMPDFFKLSSLWTPVASGSCLPFVLNVSLRGQPKTIEVNQHCPPYNAAIKPLLMWSMYIFTALYIIRIYGATLMATSGG